MAGEFTIRIGIERSGVERLLRSVDTWRKVFPPAVGAALYEEGQEWADDAVARAPEQSGFLKRTAFVSRPRARARRPEVEVGFGAPYADEVHARAALASGTPHWLEETMRDRIPGFAERIAAGARRHALAKTDARSVSARYPVRPPSGSPSKRGASKRVRAKGRK